MATIDLASNMYSYNTINPQAITASTAGTSVNTQGFESVTFVLETGAYTDGEYAVLLEVSTTGTGGWTAVYPISDDNPFDPTIGTLINANNFPYSTSTTDYLITNDVSANEAFWVGYVGPQQYIRGHIYANSATDGMLFSGSILLGSPHTAPTQLPEGNAVG